MDDDRTLMRDVTVLQPASRADRPCLILYTGEEAGRRFDLGPGRHLIGRALEASVQLATPGVSRRHAEIEVRDGVTTVRDLGSANRTYVNEIPVEGAVVLQQGDLIQVDSVVLRYHDRDSLDALLHDRIYRLAMTDAGTGTFNKRYLGDVLEREVQRARRAGHPLALVCFDLDHFKQVNDRHGHPAGDQVLREVARRVESALRGADVLCRVGGEEFVVLLPDSDLAAAVVLAGRLRAAVADTPFTLRTGTPEEQIPHRQTISLGVAALEHGLDGAALLERADRRLYTAKHSGRDRVCTEGD